MNISISVRKIFFSAKCCTKFSVLNNKSRYIEIYFVAFSLLRIKKKKRKKTLKYLKPHRYKRKRNSIEMQSFHFYICNEISEYRYVPIKRNYIFKRQENFSKVGFIDESVKKYLRDFKFIFRSNPLSRIEFPLHNTISIRISHFSLRL